jgi:hypothetical protein
VSAAISANSTFSALNVCDIKEEDDENDTDANSSFDSLNEFIKMKKLSLERRFSIH